MGKKNELFLLAKEVVLFSMSYVAAAIFLISLPIIFFLWPLIFPPKPLLPPEQPPEQTTNPPVKPPFQHSDSQKEHVSVKTRHSCGKPWKASVKELNKAIIKKVEYSSQLGTALKELRLEVETVDQQDFTIHVSPEYKVSRCPDLFTFKEGEMITVIGSELPGSEHQGNICAAEITRKNKEALTIRDRTTGTYNNALFNNEICRKELPSSWYSCGRSWKTPLMEVEGTIRKVEYKKPPWNNRAGLHLDVETAPQQHTIVHVFPELKISQCPDLFSFEEGDLVTVVGSEFSTPKNQNDICASGIIIQDSELLKLRGPITGKHDNTAFNSAVCIDEEALKRNSFFHWVKVFLAYQESCNLCIGELGEWENSKAIWLNCKDCTQYLPLIPIEYSRANDSAICQKNCSLLCSHPDRMPPECWKNCMKTCGSNMGDATGWGVKKREEFLVILQQNYPDLWQLRLAIRRRESLAAYILFILL
jgi:hypothetical protein